jgi:hypothetical protein
MIYVTSIVLKSWFREGFIAIASKDDSHTLGREVLRRNVRHDLRTEPIRVRKPLHELRCAQLLLCLALDWPPERRQEAAFAKSIRRDAQHLPEFFKRFSQCFPTNLQVRP